MNVIIPAERVRLSNERVRVGLPSDTQQNGSVRMVNDASEVSVLEFRCSCGKTTLVECEHSGGA